MFIRLGGAGNQSPSPLSWAFAVGTCSQTNCEIRFKGQVHSQFTAGYCESAQWTPRMLETGWVERVMRPRRRTKLIGGTTRLGTRFISPAVQGLCVPIRYSQGGKNAQSIQSPLTSAHHIPATLPDMGCTSVNQVNARIEKARMLSCRSYATLGTIQPCPTPDAADEAKTIDGRCFG